jgi:effector-binding domain-containing protein
MTERATARGGLAVLVLAAGCTKSSPPTTPPATSAATAPPAAAPASEEPKAADDAPSLAPTTYDVRTEVIETQPVVQVRVEAAASELGGRFAEVFGAIYPYVAQQGATPTGPPYGCYHEFAPDRVVVDIGVPVTQPVPASGDLQPGELPAGTVAFTTHAGSYQHLQRAHDAVKRWMAANRRQARGVPCDLYEVGPGQVAEERQYRTRVVYWLEE